MSTAFRPILRPVVWSEVDANGRTNRRARSPDADTSNYDHESLESPPRKKKKSLGLPAVYYPPALSPSEKVWRDRYGYLYQRGYQIRPRYQPNWTPTCFGNGRHHHSGEDHIMQIVRPPYLFWAILKAYTHSKLPQVLDAIRRQDGLVVCIKMIQDPKKIKQIKITEYFSSRRMTSDSRNHVVPFYDTFGDSFSPHIQYMVMPVLRRFDDPEFLMVCEVVDFVSQVLEGLAFLHENNVAHHNLTAEHIMMDAKSIVPTGWHFVSHFCEPDGMTRISPLERKNHSVRYYFIGFGNCYHLAPDKAPLVTDIGGGDDDVPELFNGKPYDPFKVDIYTLGNVILKELYQKYHSLEFLQDLISCMRVRDFEKRSSAGKILRSWYRTRDSLDEDAIEEQPLRYRDGARPRFSYDSDSQASANARSHKRDISSILNKASHYSSKYSTFANLFIQ
ncbi:kinase-like domain-containing protein [Flammula alnicola]|nr:kinase-like domain-containing protein [Flammula alnicola]